MSLQHLIHIVCFLLLLGNSGPPQTIQNNGKDKYNLVTYMYNELI